jgi:hypothetical protein
LIINHNLADHRIVAQAWARNLAGTWRAIHAGPVKLTGADVLDDGIVAFWKMDDAIGTRPLDSGRLAIRTLGTVQSTVSGRVGAAASFNEAGDFRVEPSDASRLHGVRTFGAWLFMNGPASGQSWIPWAIDFSSGTVARFLSFGSSNYNCWSNGVPGIATPGVAVAVNEWHHVACVFTDTEVQLYVDGALRSSSAYPGTLPVPNGTFWLGGHNGQTINGQIDEAFVAAKAMSAAELLAIMNGVTGYGSETLSGFSIDQPDNNTVVLTNDTPRTLPLRLEVMK